jgi:hypothetical protein
METQDYSFESLSKTIYDNGLYIETAFVDFVAGLQDYWIMSKSIIRSEHVRNGETFRAHIKYQGKVCEIGS